MRRPKDRELTLPARLSEASEIHGITIGAVSWSLVFARLKGERGA
ncbi:hypothetical protein V5E97_03905 [Singulisphaera sp. Ch08]|uniref:Uncharacterized protein n=1 Tax=Singulisphaera sp. Ch08 TaxID=3120278 RepID=A0AAU7CJ46_9BACT